MGMAAPARVSAWMSWVSAGGPRALPAAEERPGVLTLTSPRPLPRVLSALAGGGLVWLVPTNPADIAQHLPPGRPPGAPRYTLSQLGLVLLLSVPSVSPGLALSRLPAVQVLWRGAHSLQWW